MGGDGRSFCHKRQVMHKKSGVLAPTGRNDCATRIVAPGALAVTGCAKWVRVRLKTPLTPQPSIVYIASRRSRDYGLHAIILVLR